MQRGVYSGATAMASAQQALDIVANNLANAATVGFKRDGAAFDDGLIRAVAARGGTGETLGSIGSGAVMKEFYTDFSPGSFDTTGNPLDLALPDSDAAFAVQTPGGVRYTRNGSFAVNSDRTLVDRDGRPVLDGQGQPIRLPGDGAVSVEPDGSVRQGDQTVGQVAVFRGTFRKVGNGLFSSTDAALTDAPRVQAGVLEQSNVNAVQEMVAMIRLNRAFELAQRSIQSQDEGTQRLLQALQGR
jgi:flagellar basal-body rod protein FlgF